MRLTLIAIFLLNLLSAKDGISVHISKNKLFVNEPFLLKVTVKYQSAKYIKLEDFTDKNFYVKEIKEENATKKEDYFLKNYYFALFPQRAGNLEIKPFVAKIIKIEPKTGFSITNRVESKSRTITVFSSPSEISGLIDINASAGKKEFKPDEPVSLTLILSGKANFDDIKPFELKIKNATVYSSAPVRKYELKDGKLNGKYIQKFSIISKESFKIPAFKLSYFNIQTELMETVLSRELKIRADIAPVSSKELIFFIGGSVLGAIFTALFFYKRGKKSPLDLKNAVKRAKNDKELYSLLLPYVKNRALEKFIKDLEENIYAGAKNRVDKREIIKQL